MDADQKVIDAIAAAPAGLKAELARANDLILSLYAEIEGLKVALYLATVEKEKQ